MQKASNFLGLAAALTLVVCPAAALTQDNDYKTATREEMNIPDASGHQFLHQQGRRVTACTHDNHLLLTYVFARAHKATINNPKKPIPLKRYLDGLENAIKTSAKEITYDEFDQVLGPDLGMAAGVMSRMKDYNIEFNLRNKAYMSWVYKEFFISPEPHRLCQSAS